MFILYPFLLVLFAAALIKIALPFIFRIFGWRTGATLVLEDRIGAVLFLFCSAVMAGIAYWYPWYLATYYSAPDDRYGMAMFFALPFYLVGAVIAGVALSRLLRATLRGPRNGANTVYIICGSLLALLGLSPIFMLGWTILSRRNE
jgi:hypothetical protein